MANLMERLKDHCDDDRATVFWCCGDKVLCSTGEILAFWDDVLVLKGQTPTAAESHTCRCRDLATEKLITVIVAERICGIVFGVSKCRKAALPVCCACEDSDGKKCPDCKDAKSHRGSQAQQPPAH